MLSIKVLPVHYPQKMLKGLIALNNGWPRERSTIINNVTNMKINLIIILTYLAICSCSDQQPTEKDVNIIEVGDYSFEFPNDFEKFAKEGIDSRVGYISNGQVQFQYDFGYYSNSLTKSIEEYFAEDFWKWNALYSIGVVGRRDPQSFAARTEFIGYSELDSSHYQLKFVYEGDTVLYTADVPLQISQSHIEHDTINNVAFKYVDGPEYKGLYAVDLDSYNQSLNSYLSLSIYVDSVSDQKTKEVMKILRSCKHKN